MAFFIPLPCPLFMPFVKSAGQHSHKGISGTACCPTLIVVQVCHVLVTEWQEREKGHLKRRPPEKGAALKTARPFQQLMTGMGSPRFSLFFEYVSSTYGGCLCKVAPAQGERIDQLSIRVPPHAIRGWGAWDSALAFCQESWQQGSPPMSRATQVS